MQKQCGNFVNVSFRYWESKFYGGRPAAMILSSQSSNTLTNAFILSLYTVCGLEVAGCNGAENQAGPDGYETTWITDSIS